MLLRIEHEITYNYSKPVVLEPHTIRLKPRTDPFHAVVESSLKISPEASGVSELLDLEGTSTYMAWFLGKNSSLTITMDSLVKMSDREPFDFIVYPFSSLQLPVVYSEEIHWRLHHELAQLSSDPAIELFADDAAREVQGDTLKFLTLLAKKIADEFTYTYRESGNPYPPEKTFALHEGSCRDLSLVYMAACRHMGLASRFVSGYFYDPDLSEHHLHAWLKCIFPVEDGGDLILPMG